MPEGNIIPVVSRATHITNNEDATAVTQKLCEREKKIQASTI